MKTGKLSFAATVILGSVWMGCTPDFDHIEIKPLTSPPLSVTLTSENITLPVGVAVGVIATPIDTQGDEMDSDVEVELTSKGLSIFGSDPSIDDRTFVFYGVGPGTTSIGVRIDRLERASIPVAVMLQKQ